MDTLAIFAKQPLPGLVKSRLAAETSAEWAARVADAFIRDLVDKFAGIDAQRILVHTPAEAEGYFAEVVGQTFLSAAADRNVCPTYDLVAQAPGDLGQRLASFTEQQFERGTKRLVIIGSDSPSLPVQIVLDAFRRLEVVDVVLGPATDGGYYLIGCREVPPIFDGISWGGPHVLLETIARVPASWRLGLLQPWYDVDTLADWCTLKGHTLAMRRAGVDPGMPRTEALLDR